MNQLKLPTGLIVLNPERLEQAHNRIDAAFDAADPKHLRLVARPAGVVVASPETPSTWAAERAERVKADVIDGLDRDLDRGVALLVDMQRLAQALQR